MKHSEHEQTSLSTSFGPGFLMLFANTYVVP